MALDQCQGLRWVRGQIFHFWKKSDYKEESVLSVILLIGRMSTLIFKHCLWLCTHPKIFAHCGGNCAYLGGLLLICLGFRVVWVADLFGLNELGKLLVPACVLASVSWVPLLHCDLQLQGPLWVWLSFWYLSSLLSQQVPGLLSVVTESPIFLYMCQKGTTACDHLSVAGSMLEAVLPSARQPSYLLWLYHEVSTELENALWSFLEIWPLCLLQSIPIYLTLFFFTFWPFFGMLGLIAFYISILGFNPPSSMSFQILVKINPLKIFTKFYQNLKTYKILDIEGTL